MKFSFYERDSLGIAGITATADSYDGMPPISTVRFDFDLRKMNRDRFAVACVLFFSEFLSGSVSFPENVSPELAKSIERYFSDRDVRVATVDYEPYAAPIGTNIIDVASELRSANPLNSPDETRTIYVDVLPSDEWFGTISNIDHVITSTNGHVIAADDDSRSLEVSVATAVSLCDWLYADSIRIRPPLGFSTEHLERLAELLASCNIGFISL